MLETRAVWLAYGEDAAWAVEDATLAARPGEDLCLVGRNGSGKSTLLSALNGGLAPRRGEVVVDGATVGAGRSSRLGAARAVGLVSQDPESRILGSTVGEDAAFGPRNLGLAPEEVARRVAWALGSVGLADRAAQPCSELSGGQAQRLALASALAMEPPYLALDEVGGELDEGARAGVRALLGEGPLASCGRVRATHDVLDVASATSVAVMARGRVAWQGSPRDFFCDLDLVAEAGMGESVPAAWARDLVLSDLPLSLLADPAALARALGPAAAGGIGRRPASGPATASGAAGGLVLEGVSVSAPSGPVLAGLSLAVPRGAVTLVAGVSGSGKTTAARVAAGLLGPDSGSATLDGAPVRAGAVGIAFQRPEDQTLADSVLADVMMGPSLPPCDPAGARGRAAAALAAVGLDESLWDRPTWCLSGGQRRRAALAAVVARPSGAYILDEPTVGLDGPGRAAVHAVARSLADGGAAVCVVSHDVGEWLPVADRLALVAGGRTVWEGPAAQGPSSGAFEAAGVRLPLELAVAREAGLL
ncbi:ATP-binding cassette domain-containing protein [Caniella muris]|uniref:ATP-binding cassette domain-containing protein n=1 Tax=Caniella muris TaxID=2941502 RepID=UPI00203A98C4|nr:ABC transporter ATP-binding protein [Caniella muris]